MAINEPAGRGADPQVLMTVASLTLCPSRNHVMACARICWLVRAILMDIGSVLVPLKTISYALV